MFRTRNRNIVTAQTSALARRTALTEDIGANIYLTEVVAVPFYSEPFSALEQTRCTLVTYDSERVTSAPSMAHFRIHTEVVYLQRYYLAAARLVPREAAAVLARILYAPYNHALA